MVFRKKQEARRAEICYNDSVPTVKVVNRYYKKGKSMLIGIDIGGTKCAVVQADDAGKILNRVAFATLPCAQSLAKIEELVASFAPFDAIGISCGGPLDENRGVILSPPNLPGWDEIPICERLRKRFGVPVALRNDANACALAEWRYGAGRGTKNMIFLTFGTGMGAGLILDGRLYCGTNGNAGEVGHLRMAADGPVGYGKRGSFEGFCSGGGLKQLGQMRAIQALKEGRHPLYCQTEVELPTVTAKTVADAADAGDADAIEVYRYCGEQLGRGLSILIDLLNPEAIVIGSIFSRSENLLRAEAERIIREEALPMSASVCSIRTAQLGNAIGDYAAIAVAEEARRDKQ